MTLTDGTELTPALGIGAFAERHWCTPASAPRSTPRPTRQWPGYWAAG